MSNAPTTDFFDRLEAELREAAARRPRRLLPPSAVILVAALAIGALALIPIALIGGGEERPAPSHAGPGLSPVGSVLPKGSGTPPRRHTSMVVARAQSSPAGPWQLEVSRVGSRHPKPGQGRLQHCLMLYLPATPGNGRPGLGGYCALWNRELGSRTIPRFGLAESALPPRHPRMVLVFGRVPRHARKVTITFPDGLRVMEDPVRAPPGFKQRYGFHASFFAVVVRRTVVDGTRVNWLDAAGRRGSRAIPLIPAPGLAVPGP